MSNYNQIGILSDKANKLTGVRYSIYDAGSDGQDWIDAIEMQFENGTTATVYVEVEFDTLRLKLTAMEVGDGCYVKVATSLDPWTNLIGGSLAWSWLLTNHQGYEDGFRFEFCSENGENSDPVITLIGIASKIEIYSSKKIIF